MVELIRSYLLQQGSISIPGLGTIYVERMPAHSDIANRQIIAPSYHYRFDRYFDTPGKDFFAYLAARRQMEEYESIRSYNEWAQQLRQNINGEQTITMEGIGTLSRDKSGDVVFEAAGPAPTYRVPVPAERIVRTDARHTVLVGDREMSSEELSDPFQTKNSSSRNRNWLYAALLAAVAIITIIYYLYNRENGSFFGNQQKIEVR